MLSTNQLATSIPDTEFLGLPGYGSVIICTDPDLAHDPKSFNLQIKIKIIIATLLKLLFLKTDVKGKK
jgi:hypothetical protein